MFTVKVVKASGKTLVRSCESYEKDAAENGKPPSVTLMSKGSENHRIELEPGDKVYMENQCGRTTDLIRVPK